MNSAALLADAGHSLSGEYDHGLVTYQSPFFSAVAMRLHWWNPLTSRVHPASWLTYHSWPDTHTLNPVLTCLYRSFGRFRRSIFMASISSATQPAIPLRPRKIRNGRHGTGRHPSHRWRSRHRLAFALAPSLRAFGHGPGCARGTATDCAAPHYRGGTQHPKDRAHRALSFACATRAGHERGVVRCC